MEEDSDPSLDPKVVTAQPNYSQYEIEDHRACTVYIGYYVPGYRRKGHHRRSHRHHHHGPSYNCGPEYGHDISRPVTPPSERVHFILGEEEDGSHEPHPLFSEMEELFWEGKEVVWRETARWIKFEEDVEEGGNRWSKPHVATVSLHSLFELRSFILNGTILLDMDAHGFEEIIDLILENMESSNQISADLKDKIKEDLLRPHRHQHEWQNEWSDKGSRIPLIRSLTDVGRNTSKFSSHKNSASTGVLPDDTTHNSSSVSFRSLVHGKNAGSPDDSAESFFHKNNQAFMRKIPPKAEASNILVGEVDYLDKVITAFVRLNESCHLGDLTEVSVPTRFIFILLGPPGNALKHHEIGRAMATLWSDEVFHGVAYKAKNRLDLMAGVDEFLDATTVLPPGVWDPSTRIEPPEQPASQTSRKKPEPKKKDKSEISDIDSCSESLKVFGPRKLFGGLIADVHSKAPWYISDFKDCLALQCISSIVFLYFACIAQIITFGNLLAHATNQKMAAVECLLSALICGITYSLFSGQPLTLLGNTGPVLVFEGMVFDMCERYSIDYLSLRVWIGLWTSIYLLTLVAFNMAALVRYITRFTEEIFATLISTYFIYKAIKSVIQILNVFPLKTRWSLPQVAPCICVTSVPLNYTVGDENQCQSVKGFSFPLGCSYTPPYYVPNIFLMSVILFIGTFALILFLRGVKNTPFFPSKVRTCISDFSVLIAVVCMTGLDFYIGIQTPKLEVPQTFKPERDWVIPLFGHNPWWSPIFATLPALLLTVLIFMDQQITTLIVNRKENKLKKSCGYHLDLFVLAILIGVCSIFGLPWFVAATVLSITHVNSLKRLSQCSTPGEKPHFLGVREQRVTHFVVVALLGLSVFFTNILQFIPMPILYGVFLFMGVTSLKGLQFFERIMLMFMPEKYQPDYNYLRHVPIRQVKLYTILQFSLFALLFCCKLFKFTAFAFPLLLLGVILIRKLLVYVFDKTHLKILDDITETIKVKKEDPATVDKGSSNLSEVVCADTEQKNSMNNCNSHANINISEMLMQSGIWKSIDQQSRKASKKFLVAKTKKKKRGGKQDASKSEERKRLSVMEEEEEDYVNSPPTSSPSQPSTVPLDSPSPETDNKYVI